MASAENIGDEISSIWRQRILSNQYRNGMRAAVLARGVWRVKSAMYRVSSGGNQNIKQNGDGDVFAACRMRAR